MRFDEVSRDDRLVHMHTPVAAAAEMSGIVLTASSPGAGAGLDFFFPAAQASALSERGRFVRLLDMRHPLEVDRSFPLTLVFQRGGVVDATLTVDFASFRFA